MRRPLTSKENDGDEVREPEADRAAAPAEQLDQLPDHAGQERAELAEQRDAFAGYLASFEGTH